MLENILAIRRPVAHPAYQFDELGAHPLDAGLVDGLLAGLEHRGLHLDSRLVDDLFDPSGVDAAVGDQPFERQPGDLAPDGLEAGDNDRVRGVVDDHVHAGRRLERPDVPALTPDDATLHLVGGESHGGDGRFGGGFRREPLNGERENFLGLFVGVAARLLLQVPGEGRRLVAGFVFEPAQELLLRLLRRQARDLLESGPGFQLFRAERPIALLQGPAPQLEAASAFFQTSQTLLGQLFPPLDVAAPARRFLFEGLARLHQLFLGGEHDALPRLLHQPLRLRRRRPGRGHGRAALHPTPYHEGQHARRGNAAEQGCTDRQPVHHRIYLQQRPPPRTRGRV